MKITKKGIAVIGFMFLVTFVLGGMTYAYFSAIVANGDKGSSVTIRTGVMRIVYSDNELINTSAFLPGNSVSKVVTVTNEGNADTTYDMVWYNLINELVNQDEMVMKMNCLSNTDTCDGYSQNRIASSGNDIPILYNVSISPYETHTYTIFINFLETGYNQNYNQNKIIEGKIGISDSTSRHITWYGRLLNNNGDAMSDTIVEVHSDVVSTITDSKGYFQFNSIPYGNHEIVIKDGNSVIKSGNINLKLDDQRRINVNDISLNNNYSQNIDITVGNILSYSFEESLHPLCFNMDYTTGTINYINDGYYQEQLDQYNNGNYFVYNNQPKIKRLSNVAPYDYLCNSENLIIPDHINGIEIKYIANNFDYYQVFNNVILPDSLLGIGNNAFSNVFLDTITIPRNVSEIGNGSFSGNPFLYNIVNLTGESFCWDNILNSSNNCNSYFGSGTYSESDGYLVNITNNRESLDIYFNYDNSSLLVEFGNNIVAEVTHDDGFTWNVIEELDLSNIQQSTKIRIKKDGVIVFQTGQLLPK